MMLDYIPGNHGLPIPSLKGHGIPAKMSSSAIK
jgi:hypothetical protein